MTNMYLTCEEVADRRDKEMKWSAHSVIKLISTNNIHEAGYVLMLYKLMFSVNE